MTLPVYSVSELTLALKKELEPRFQNILVEGEISNLKRQSSGHIYFTLKDREAQLSCVFFKGAQSKTPRLPKEGDQVTLGGELSIYPPRGSYQMIVRQIRFQGDGELLQRFHELKEKLKQQGWLESTRKKKIPLLPKCIGAVTSPTGAAIQDILHILKRRFSNFSLLLYPVKVQGEGAAEEIAQAIQEMNIYSLVDVLIVGRGGGSIEDLWAFNEEIVASAVYHSQIPIISAVGHETDFTLCDLVADVRAPTPSAAAEIVLQEKKNLLEKLGYFSQRFKQNLGGLVQYHKAKVKGFSSQAFFSSPYTLLGKWLQKLDEKEKLFQQVFFHYLASYRQRLDLIKKQLYTLSAKNQQEQIQTTCQKLQKRFYESWSHYFENKKHLLTTLTSSQRLRETIIHQKNYWEEKLFHLEQQLHTLNPKNLFKKGYTILFSEKDHSIILSVKDAKPGEGVYALLDDGKLFATIKEEKQDEDTIF